MLLYIHIPFCDSKCFYCAFNSYTTKFNLKKDYMRALNKQLLNDLKINNIKKNSIETLFIGGGTPSTIKAEDYKELFDILKPYLKKNSEITTEANPNSANLKWLKGMYNYGVNRISFGVQSFNNEKLKFLGRAHNNLSAKEAIIRAKDVGFEKISCDIIYGVEKDTFESVKKDLDMAFSLPITHLSAYSLIIEEGTKFFNKNNIKIDDEELSYKIFDYINKNNFTQYEISNFTINEENKSKHNFGYWSHKEYLGVGAGAVGYIKNRRYYPQKSIEEYISKPLKYEYEDLNLDNIKVEKVLLGLRCSLGINLNILSEKQKKKVEELLLYSKVYIKNDRIYNRNFLLADEIALYILD